MDNHLWYFELTAPSTVDLIDRIDRVTMEHAESGDLALLAEQRETKNHLSEKSLRWFVLAAEMVEAEAQARRAAVRPRGGAVQQV